MTLKIRFFFRATSSKLLIKNIHVQKRKRAKIKSSRKWVLEINYLLKDILCKEPITVTVH